MDSTCNSGRNPACACRYNCNYYCASNNRFSGHDDYNDYDYYNNCHPNITSASAAAVTNNTVVAICTFHPGCAIDC